MTTMSRLPVGILVGLVGGIICMLMSYCVWALTAGLPTFLRYATGFVVAVVVGLRVGDAALYLEARSNG